MIANALTFCHGMVFWAPFLTWMFWPTAQNAVSTGLAGQGPRHRDSGMATPWHRSRPAHEYDVRFRADGSRRPRWRPTNAPIYAVEMREWGTASTRLPSPLERIQAVDLSGLQRLAGGPL